jgi:hypothetical protein
MYWFFTFFLWHMFTLTLPYIFFTN